MYKCQPLQFYYEGEAIPDDLIVEDYYPIRSIIIDKVKLTARDAPVGSDITIDFVKNDVEQNNIITLSAGSKSEETDVAGVEFKTNDKLGLKIKTVGSTTAGGGITVYLYFWPHPLANEGI